MCDVFHRFFMLVELFNQKVTDIHNSTQKVSDTFPIRYRYDTASHWCIYTHFHVSSFFEEKKVVTTQAKLSQIDAQDPLKSQSRF